MKKWIMQLAGDPAGNLKYQHSSGGSAYSGSWNNRGRQDKKLKIVTTIFPEYDWTRAVLGDREADVDLTMLLDNGTDLHSFPAGSEGYHEGIRAATF